MKPKKAARPGPNCRGSSRRRPGRASATEAAAAEAHDRHGRMKIAPIMQSSFVYAWSVLDQSG